MRNILTNVVLIAFLSSPNKRLLVGLKARCLGQKSGSVTHVITTQYIGRWRV